MQVYTKTGDKGLTSIIGGAKVSKAAARVAAYGTIDELNSFIGYAISQMPSYRELKNQLQEIQQVLFDCGTDMATPNDSQGYRTKAASVTALEQQIDKYTALAPAITEFILPGGSPLASILHVIRTIVRRGEREVVAVAATEAINEQVLVYLNRLSDYFYVIARYVNQVEGRKDISYRRNRQVFH